MVDLRTTKAQIQYDQTFSNGFDPVSNRVFDKNTNVYVGDVTANSVGDISISFTANNNALVTMDFDISRCADGVIFQACGGFEGNWGYVSFKGNGSYVINANMHANQDYNEPSAFFEMTTSPKDQDQGYNLEISSALTFKAIGNVGSFLRITTGSNNGFFKFNSPYLEVDLDNNGANKNTQKYFIYTEYYYDGYANIYVNADENNPANAYSQSSVLKITGNILSTTGTHLYANFTNPASFLKGDIKLGSGSAKISFSNGSQMTGNIDVIDNGTHSITFDNADFIGTVKSSANSDRSANTTITFANTAGNTFGNGTDDIVASSYKGAIVGTFDVSANSTTNIKGGSDGSKGFFGAGENALFFDFKGSVRDNTPENKRFTIGGGNANSVYVINAFQKSGESTFNLSNLNAQDNTTLYNKLGNAGVNIAVDTQSDNQKNHLNGTLFFQRTNITVGDGNNALFANQANIVGADNALNGLALGAMFGNATWNDENKDGSITSEEITPNNGGTNYKLSALTPASGENINDTTSTGNIGSANDGIKKQVAFIFDKSSYTFGGDKQGYSGIINGGTSDSKYYFANAGYIGRTQIAGALGDLVLFNTAFRGDLGVNNNDVSIVLDFSEGRNGLRAESGNANANIVGAGSKNVTFNFTGNTLKDKFTGAVVGDATAVDASGSTDTDTAKYTMLNLKKYTADGTPADNDGRLAVTTVRAGGSGKTLIDAFREAGLTNFNKTDGNSLGNTYGSEEGKDNTTNIDELSTSNTTFGLRGTSLDTANIDFSDYIYDFAFGSGAEIGSVEGVILNDSKLKGVIDLTEDGASNSKANANSGHSFVFKGTAIDGTNSGVLASNGQLAGFSYDDSTATYSQPVTFKLSGLSRANYVTTNGNGTTVTGDSLVFTQTNLEGNLWADNSVAVNLDFTDGRTWKMDSSGIYLKSGSNLVIHGAIEAITEGQTPTLGIRTSANLQDIQLINTGVSLTWNNDTAYCTDLSQTFVLRGTGLQPHSGQRISGRVNSGKSNFNMVFAKGINLQTIVMDAQTGGTAYDLTNIGVNTGWVENEEGTRTQLTHKGTYSDGVYDGNYVATSSGDIRGTNTDSGFDITFIGSQAWSSTEGEISTENYFGQASTLTLVNASNKWENGAQNVNGISAGYLGKFFQRNIGTQATIIVEGTSIDWGNEGDNGGGIVRRDGNQDKLTFKMTFINEGANGNGNTNTDETYVGDKYTDLATTNANGALSDSVLKVQESKLVNGLNFKGANAFVTFVGDEAQSLDGTSSGGQSKILNGGSASSVFTFRDSNLNAGNGTSSIQNIKGTIAFDLTHTNEDMEISGTLKNMLASGGKHQVQFTGRGDSAEPVSIDRLVFVKMSDLTTLSDSLGKFDDSETSGNYFSDTETFGNLSQADYSDLALLANVDNGTSSSLIFADNATVALESGEVLFVGENSHKFNTDSNANKLGDSTGGTLAFVDAGTLKIDNLLNVSGSTQQGKGTINLIGTTRIETQSIQSATTLTLKKGDATGAGITVNAVFTGSNVLGTGVAIKGASGATDTDIADTIASNVNIGQDGEETAYHILFDYTDTLKDKEKKGFGKYQVYQGTITGLTDDSVIKFKNAGYITNDQIANTNANILVDNTQIKGNFTGDKAFLDFRNNQPAVDGNIITSDPASSDKKLSRKILTFDLTGSDSFEFSNAIQAGYKIAPAYDTNGQSVLTFQNAPTLSLGDDGSAGGLRGARTPNSSAFIQSLATDAGFSGIGSAITDEPSAGTSISDSDAYILKGTKLAFQGTNITANTTDHTITENTYFLDLSFDKSDVTGQTALGEALSQSVLTANSIVMGALNEDNPLGLSLSFKNQGSLVGAIKANEDETISFSNVLDVKLKDNAIFNLNAESSNGNIGTIVLSENTPARAQAQTDTLTLSAQSSMNIQAGAMNFVGVFDTTKDTATTSSSDYGTLDLSFGDVYQTDEEGNVVTDASGNKVVARNNKAYGIIAHKGAMSVSLTGDALLSDEQAQALGYAKDESQFADLVIDTSDASSATLALDHSSGVVGVIGKDIVSGGTSQSSFTNINLSSVAGNIALKGAFDLGNTRNSFTQNNQLTFAGDTYLKLSNGASLTLTEDGTSLIASEQTPSAPTNLYIDALGSSNGQAISLTLTNLDPSIQVNLMNNIPFGNMWGYNGAWDIRGTNINLDKVFWAEGAGNTIKMVFAKGEGRETTVENAESSGYLKLSELTASDKINESALTGALSPNQNEGNYHTNGDGSSLLLKNASLTFIGKESLGVSEANQRIDGSYNGGGTFKIGLYNTILKSGSILLDSSVATNNSSRSISDQAIIAGTDTFNLSVSKIAVPSNASGLHTATNNSTLNAVYVNGTTTSSDASITGVRYIDSSASYASAYATSNAGGALSETQLKTLESKAYGNITLDNTVTATMKFIGENSHSFDGKTKVDSSGNVYYSADGQSNWKQYTIGNGTDNTNGAVYLAASTTDTSTSGFTLATLSGGNTNSRFDFDRTSVSLDLIKNAGGSTYIYNSNVIGNIKVESSTAPAGSTTTIFFNQAYTPADMPTAVKTFASEYAEKKDINLDLATAHTLKTSNLESGKLSTTSKITNLVLLGAGSVENANDNGNILLNFLPDASTSSGYNYTIVSGGIINLDDYKNELGESQDTGNNDVTGQAESIFGDSNVVFIDTIVKGMNATNAKGFVDVARNTETTWMGSGDQFIIFNFNDGASNRKLYNGKANAIKNTSANSRYIFSGIFANSSFANSPRVLTLTGENSLKAVINNKLGITAISDDVKGYLGLRGISVQGNINEDTTDGNGVDIVFNSTNNLAYKEGFDASGKHYANIVEGANLVSTDLRDDSKISGYAVLKTAEGEQTVTISGSANKDITFIGEGAVEGGFDKLVITEGSKDSNYTFHTVGKLSETFLGNVGLFHSETSRATNEAVAGNFKFVNSTIVGDINANQSSADSGRTNTLKFENVNYSGTISGTLKKDLVFGAGSDKIKIIGGSEDSVYDFSNLAGKSIELDIDLSNGSSGYINSAIAGFKEGNISVVGYLNVESSSKFAFNDNASWTLTESSKVGNLELNNSGTNFNLNLASAPRTASQVGAEGQPSNDLRVLNVNNLFTEGGQVLLGTAINQEDQSLSQSDKINTKAISGTLYVTAEDASIEKGSFDTENNAIVLVTSDYIEGEVKGTQRKQGLSYSVTELEHQVSDGSSWSEATAENTETAQSHRWVLSSLNTETNQELVDESGFIVSNPYRMLVIETNNLNKRMGDLRDDNYNQGAWIRVFNGMDSGEGAKNLYTNIQLGYDYGTPAIGAKNYTGVAFSTSIVDIDGNQYSGKANTYSLGVYNAYIADSGLYVDTIAKYLYTDQKVSPAGSSDSSFGSHALSLGLEVGYRAYMGESNFYIEPQAEAIGGIIFGVKDINMGVVGGMNINGELKTTTTINTRVGLVQGYSLKTQSGFRADFRLGVSLVNEFVSESDPVRLYDGVTEASTSIGNDVKAVVNVGTNLILTDQWRVYIDAERSFGGARNVDYQANIGARFSFGDTSKPAPTHHEQYKAIATPLKVDNLKEHKEESESEAQTEKQQDKKTK